MLTPLSKYDVSTLAYDGERLGLAHPGASGYQATPRIEKAPSERRKKVPPRSVEERKSLPENGSMSRIPGPAAPESAGNLGEA